MALRQRQCLQHIADRPRRLFFRPLVSDWQPAIVVPNTVMVSGAVVVAVPSVTL